MRAAIQAGLEMVTAMIKITMKDAILIKVTVVEMIRTQTIVLNVNALKI